jgi:hypothetical protein
MKEYGYMGKVTTGFSMSLDGFIAGPNEDFQHLFAWMAGGDIGYTVKIGDREQKLKISSESIKQLDDAINTTGALVAGRRLYELTHGYIAQGPVPELFQPLADALQVRPESSE